MEPRITVLVAHKNYQEYLPDAIKSCLGQTLQAHICVIDDGSTDQESVTKILEEVVPGDTTKQVVEFGTIIKHPKYTLILLNEGGGPSFARNVGISVTQDETDYYVVLDADDIMRPHKVELLYRTICMDKTIGVVYGDFTSVNTQTGKLQREWKEPFSIQRLGQECIVHSGAMFSKLAALTVVEDSQVYDNLMRTCEDYDLWIRIAERFMICHIAEDLTLVRIQPQNSTVTVDTNIWNQNWTRIRDKVAQREAKRRQ
jgi:glycosyltransferase involved in cell wall biosynthesis